MFDSDIIAAQQILPDTLILEAGSADRFDLDPYLLIGEDTDKQLTLDKLKEIHAYGDFKPFNHELTELKPHTVYWVVFTLRNRTHFDRHLILDFNRSVDVISTQVFSVGDDRSKLIGSIHKKINHQQLGNQVGRADTVSFFIEKQGYTEIAIRIESDYEICPRPQIRLFSKAGWYDLMARQNLVQGVFQGIAAMLMISGLFLFFSIRDKTYLLYFGLVFFSAFYFLQSYDYLGSGSALEFLWTPSLYLSIICNFLFVRCFIKDVGHYPKFENALLIAAGFTALNAIIYTIVYFVSYYQLLQFNGYFLFFYLAFNVLVFLLLLPIRNLSARILVVGSILYALACILSISTTWIDKKDMLQSGFLIQQVIFGLALSEKIRSERKQINMVLENKVRERTQELALKQEKIERQNKELQEFAYVISHDLKAPLRGIGTISSWLSTDYGDQFDHEGKENIRLLTNRARKMEALIEDILNYSKLGRQQEPLIKIDFDNLINECLELLDVPGNITVHIDSNLKIFLGRKVQLTQVFQNLISNAIKYMDKEYGIIELGAATDVNGVKLWVKDNGIGIDEKYHKKVFKMFQTLRNEETYESTGVGLAIVKKIIELNKGHIWIESEVNIGTTMHIILPQKFSESSTVKEGV